LAALFAVCFAALFAAFAVCFAALFAALAAGAGVSANENVGVAIRIAAQRVVVANFNVFFMAYWCHARKQLET
jgi:hypothetical protein